MKKQFFYAFLLISLLGLQACKKDRDNDLVAPVSFALQLDFGEDVKELNLPKKDAEVKLTNTVDGQQLTTKTDEDGIAHFESITPGTYNISASLIIDADVYNAASGTQTDQDAVFNVSQSAQAIYESNEGNPLALTYSAGQLGDWVIKQVYYAGSDTRKGALFRDQFIEIYNNSNQVLYADSLYICMPHASDSKMSSIDWTKDYYLSPSGSLDWRKVTGQETANDQYIYTRDLLRVPSDGTGKKYPVQPGESFIMAKKAMNHKEPFVGNNGTVYSVADPSLTFDLTDADFDTYYGDYVAQTSGQAPNNYDILIPGKTKMDVIASNLRYYNMDNNGREAFVIFKTPEDVTKYPSFQAPDVPATSNKSYQIPVDLIIDAVEVETLLESARTPKRLPATLDAGPTHVTDGPYSSQSLVRRTSKTVNGRRILKDTNNSANDFGTKTKADPSKSASSFLD